MAAGLQQGGWYPERRCKERDYSRALPTPSSYPSLLACSLPARCPGRWSFGDGEQVIGQFKPPYNESFQVPDPTVAQVLVEHNITHTYTVPGKGQACCPASLQLGRALPRGQPLPGGQPPLVLPPGIQPGLMAQGPHWGEEGLSRVEGWIRPLRPMIQVCRPETGPFYPLLTPPLSLFWGRREGSF